MFSICQTNFGQDGGRRSLQHFRLGKSGTRPSETSKEEIALVHDNIIQNKWSMARALKVCSD